MRQESKVHRAELKEKLLQENFAGIYIHFPFCEAKCHYCDFFSFAEEKIPSTTQKKIYEALVKEMGFYEGIYDRLRTVFLGGGTPSLVPLDFLEQTLAPLQLKSSRFEEVTIEANPSSITYEKAVAWKNLGINRVSLGLQAYDNDRLKWLDRVHTVEETEAALDAIQKAGFDNVSVDFILGVPGLTTEKIRSEISTVLSKFHCIQHVSAYLLTLKENSEKFRQLYGDEEQLNHLLTAHDTLASFGFEHYEISNYSKPGKRARHNENYWLGSGYLAVGPSSHGYWAHSKMRTKHWSSLEKYLKSVDEDEVPFEWTETITPAQEELEFLMLKLRRRDGLTFQEFKDRFGAEFKERYETKLRILSDSGLVDISNTGMKLSTKGLFLCDSVLSKLV